MSSYSRTFPLRQYLVFSEKEKDMFLRITNTKSAPLTDSTHHVSIPMLPLFLDEFRDFFFPAGKKKMSGPNSTDNTFVYTILDGKMTHAVGHLLERPRANQICCYRVARISSNENINIRFADCDCSSDFVIGNFLPQINLPVITYLGFHFR